MLDFMIGDSLQKKLQPLKEAEDLIFRRWLVSAVMLSGAGVLVVLAWLAVQRQGGAAGMIVFLVLAGFILVWGGISWKKRQVLDLKKLAEQIEGEFPDLQQVLLTAVEQQPGPDGKLGFLQQRVVEEAVDHALEHDWLNTVYRPQLLVAAWVQGFAIFNAVIMLIGLGFYLSGLDEKAVLEEAGGEVALAAYQMAVTPGDAEVERGQRLIVEAQFDGRIPSTVKVVVMDPAGEGKELARVEMKQGLQDGMFSGLIRRIDRDVRYRLEFDDGRSEDYKITTYVHPELQRADVWITPPEYAGLKKKQLKDVRKVSALQGSQLKFSLKVNKAVVAAELYGEDERVIPLLPSEADETILEATFVPAKSQRYRVHLVDADDRMNKQPPWLKVSLKKNEPPRLDLLFPKRDLAVSAVQELPVEAQVWDDLGVTATGAVFVVGDEEKDVSLSQQVLAGGKKHSLKTLLAIEELGVKPRDLISYYLWAEDRDAKGQVRRVMSDMFFAEVRHFEDIFREAEAMSSKGPPKQGESDKLVDLQKKVINATWKVMRRAGAGEEFGELEIDVTVVKEAQQIVAGKVDAVLEKVKDAQIRTYLESAKGKMLQAVMELDGVLQAQKSKGLAKAMKTSRGAYEDLLLAQGREHQVTRAQNPKPGGGGKKKMESQLMQLELKQQEKRYEKASEAKDQPAKTAEQKENLAVLNRLKELARRQEALAKKIKELENALAKADSDAQKDELKKQLKRLQQQQQQLLRDLDDVTERMEKPENRANMAEEKKKLEQTREKVREAAEELKKGELADAANAATRAQRDLDKVKEDFRQKTSRRFSEEMRGIRNQARDLAKQQQEIGAELEESGMEAADNQDPFGNQESLLKNLEIGRDLDAQRKALADLLDKMRKMSEAAESSEALLSTALYEGVRKAQTQGVDAALEEARDLGRLGRSDLAQEAEGRAARGIDELKKNVEKAAGKVLGNEGDALRMARAELDDLLRQVEEEKNNSLGKGAKKSAGGEKMDLAMNEAGGKKGEGKSKGESGRSGKVKPTGKALQGKGKDGKDKDGGAPAKGEGSEAKKQAGGKEGQGEGAQAGGKAGGEMAGQSGYKAEQGKAGKGQVGGGESQGKGKGSAGLAQSELSGRSAGSSEVARSGQTQNSGVPRAAPLFFEGAEEEAPGGPLMGKDYEKWTDRLRDVEEALDDPKLRNEVAKVLDNARAMRIDHQRNNLSPQANVIDQKIIAPLVELRDRVSEHLSRMDEKNPLAPIDRDPVPPEYRALVKKYYQQLGAGR